MKDIEGSGQIHSSINWTEGSGKANAKWLWIWQLMDLPLICPHNFFSKSLTSALKIQATGSSQWWCPFVKPQGTTFQNSVIFIPLHAVASPKEQVIKYYKTCRRVQNLQSYIHQSHTGILDYMKCKLDYMQCSH